MRRSSTSLVALVVVAAFLASCSDRQPTGAPQPPTQTSLSPTACTATVSSLQVTAGTLFGAQSPYLGSVRDTLAAIDAKLKAGSTAAAQAQAEALAAFVQSKAGTIPGTPRQIDDFVNNLLCWVGVAQQHSFLVAPIDQPQVLKTSDGTAGIQLPPNAVSTPTVVTITVVDGDLLTSDDTKLDRYPRSISVSASTAVASSTVGVCVKDIRASVFAHLRMGHRTANGFKIENPAPTAFLGCPGDASSLASRGSVKRWLQALASLVLPTPLYARMQGDGLISGGVGGSATEFSPFEPVDTQLWISGGVGGTAGEFIKAPAPASSRRASTVAGGVCTAVEAIVGGALEPECRPRMEIRTANGTILQNVPVSWTIGVGLGTVAPENPVTRVCGTFGPSAATSTNVNGKAGACWTLGSVIGLNTLIATPGAGGDAPAGVTFFPLNHTFSANALTNTPTVTATGEVAAYDGQAHPGSGTCSNGLIPELEYSGDGSVPRNVGQYALTVTCGGGSTIFNAVTATADITIGLTVPVIAISCPSAVVYTGLAQSPCSATVRATGLNLTPAPTYSANVDAGTVTATVVYSGGSNYGPATASRNFSIGAAPTTTTIACPVSRVYTGAAIAPCTATVVGPNGLSLARVPGYTANVNAGIAVASYTYPSGGNYLSSSDLVTFQILAAASVTAVACPGSVAYTGANQSPCTAAATGVGALNQALAESYSPSPVRNAGTYAVTAAYAGDANHTGSSGSASFVVAPAPATATAGSGAMISGGVVPALPCTISVLPVDAAAVTCTTNVPSPLDVGANTTTPIVTPASPANYAVTEVNGTLTVTAQQADCFDGPISSSLPPKTSYLVRGVPLAIKCTLRNAQGGLVTNASGDLRIHDIGSNGLATPKQVLFRADAFTLFAGSYWYWLNTWPDGFESGHYYRVTAAWNDGSTTTGYFYLRVHDDDR